MSLPAFELPATLEADEPPERRGLTRDGVRLLVASKREGAIRHARFVELPALLNAGDLLVVNVSATLPAAVAAGRADGSRARVHFSTRAPDLDPRWRVVELRTADGTRPARARAGESLSLPGGADLELTAPYASGKRLLLARFTGPADSTVEEYLARHGEPIRYRHAAAGLPLTDYQNVYATTPGSAEMASAGRPFTATLIATLAARGTRIAGITLHAGVSSPERHEPPFMEEFDVPAPTAALVNAVHGRGGRVIAVGTTVVRALETAARGDGSVRAVSGWTNLVITPERRMRAVDGLITGWHEPEASHLQMLEAVAGPDLLARSYHSAVAHGYLWHEFGDSHLIMP